MGGRVGERSPPWAHRLGAGAPATKGTVLPHAPTAPPGYHLALPLAPTAPPLSGRTAAGHGCRGREGADVPGAARPRAAVGRRILARL